MKHCSSCGAASEDSVVVCPLCGDTEWIEEPLTEAATVDISKLFQGVVVLDPQNMAIYRQVLKQSYFWYKQVRFWVAMLPTLVLCSFLGDESMGGPVWRAVLLGVVCSVASILSIRHFRTLTGAFVFDDGKTEALYTAVYGKRYTIMEKIFFVFMLIMAYSNWEKGSGIGFALLLFFAGFFALSAVYHSFWAFHAAGVVPFFILMIIFSQTDVVFTYIPPEPQVENGYIMENNPGQELSDTTAASEVQTSTVSESTPEAEILGAKLVTDPMGSNRLIVTYEWTNLTNQPSSAIYNVAVDAYQNGIGLEEDFGFILEDDSSQREVQPGVTIQVREAFLIEDMVTDVQVEITPWISFEYEVIDSEIFRLQ